MKHAKPLPPAEYLLKYLNYSPSSRKNTGYEMISGEIVKRLTSPYSE